MEILVETANDLNELTAKLGDGGFDFVAIHGNFEAVGSGLPDIAATKAVHGATSCLGAMTHAGPTDGIAAFAIRDAAGTYGTSTSKYDTNPKAAAEVATRQALINADRFGEQPDLIWVSGTPGCEEEVLAGIEAVVGADVPIIGGSAADNTVEGNWFVFDHATRVSDGVVVSVLFPSSRMSFAYQNGYSPTNHHGVVTRVDGRKIQEIDGKPALEIYSQWTGGAIETFSDPDKTRAILADSTLWPLGRETTQLGDVPFYLLAHPAVAHGDGSMDLFANVEVGEKLTLMSGSKESLTARAGRVASLARTAGGMSSAPISGALMIYCGGCMLSVRDDLETVSAGVVQALEGAPFLGAFTFGEQGFLLRSGNRHGNLMISCIVFE